MPRRFRNILLISVIIVFLGVGVYLMLLGNGWVWNKETFSFVKTGGIFLSFNPWGATIYLNGKQYPDTTSFLSRGILIQNLPPKSYTVRLEKTGSFAWEKTLVVTPGEVASAHDIHMWPQHPEGTVVAAGIKDFWITQPGILVQNAIGALIFENRSVRGTSVFFSSPHSNMVITKERILLFLTNLTNPDTTTNLSSLFSSLLARFYPKATDEILFVYNHPTNLNRILIQTSTGLYSLDSERVELTQIFQLTPKSLIAFSERNAYAFTKNGNLLSYYFHIGTFASSTVTPPFPTSTLQKIFVSPNGKTIVFETTETAYLYDQTNQKFLGVTDPNATLRVFSPEEKRLLSFFSEKKFLINYLAEYEYDALYAKGTQEDEKFPYSLANLTKLAWLPYQNTLLALNKNSIIGIDTDMRLPSNTRVLIKDIQKAEWNDALFILKENGELWTIEY